MDKSLTYYFRALAIFFPDIFLGYIQLFTSFNDSEDIIYIKMSRKSDFVAKLITLAPGTIAFFEGDMMCVHCLSSSKDTLIKHLKKLDREIEIIEKTGG